MRYIKIILVIFFMEFCTSNGQNNISGIYSISEFQQGFGCNISLYPSGKYYIEIVEEISNDIVEAFILSYGEYSIQNSIITLEDKTQGCRMYLQKQDNNLTVDSAFIVIQNKCFVFNQILYDTEEPIFIHYEVDTSIFVKNLLDYNKSNQKFLTLESGVYESPQGEKILLRENKEYELSYKKVLLSKGSYSRNKCIIRLLDSNIHCSFTVLVDKKGLIIYPFTSSPGFKTMPLIKSK